MSASNKFFNVFLIGALGLAGLFVSLFLLLGTDRATSARYEAAVERLEAGDLDAARLAFEQALERSEDKAPAAYQLARLAAAEDPEAALPYIRQALEEGSPTGEQLAVMTRVALAAREIDLASDLIESLQRTDPGDLDLMPLRGGLAVVQRRGDEAVAIFEELYSSGAANAEAKFALGQLLAGSDRILDQTRAKVILMETARENSPAGQNAFLFIVASGRVRMEPRDWNELLSIGAERNFLKWESIRTNLPFLRRLMVLASMHHPELALDIAETRVEHPDADTVDLLDAAEMALKQNEIRRAEQLLAEIPEAERDSRGYRLVVAHQRILEGRPDMGVEALQTIFEEAPEDLPLLAVLRDLAKGREGLLSVRERIAVLSMLAQHPFSTLENRFESYDQLLEIRPLARREIMVEVRDALGPKAPAAVASWFLSREQADYALQLITPAMGRSNANLFELRVLALLQSGALDEAEAYLDERPAIVSNSLMKISRLRLAIARENADEARRLWGEALELVREQGNTQAFPLLAKLAEAFQAEDLALTAYRLAMDRGAPMNELQWLAFSSLAERAKDLDLHLAVAEAALQAYPRNPVMINNFAYFQLLRGRDLAANLRRMEDLVEDYPEIDAFHVTLALAYLKNDRASQAIRTMERIEIDWTPAGASSQVIYIAALADGERRAMAENFARNVDQSTLLLEERELIATLLSN